MTHASTALVRSSVMADPRLLAFLADLGASDAQLAGLDDYSLIGVAGDL